jgi:hypothetical protein
MIDQEITLEVTSCVRMRNGNVRISPKRGRAVFVIAFGLPMALFSVWLLISPVCRDAEVFLTLFLGGALVYLGVRALTAPEISIEVDSRLIQIHKRGSQSAQTWSFESLEDVKGVPTDTRKGSDIRLLRASLHFKDGESLPLFTTADVKKAKEVGQWLYAAFAS